MGSRSKLTPSRLARTQAVWVYSEPGTVAHLSCAIPTCSAEPFDVRRSARDPAGHAPSEPSSVTADTEPPSPLWRNVSEAQVPAPIFGSSPPRVSAREGAAPP